MTKLSPKFMDSESIMLLSSAKIFSVSDFLQADSERIVSFSKFSIEEVLHMKTCLIKQFSSSPINALDMFKSTDDKVFIKTHIEGFDILLSGGLLKGSVLELCGPSGCGKTQLCHSIAVNCALHSNLVEFIDTKGDFSASRTNMLLPMGLNDEEMDHVLEQINFYSTRNIYELISVLQKLQSSLKTNTNGKDNIVIIDSITVPYLPFVGVSTSKESSHSDLDKLIANFNIGRLASYKCSRNFPIPFKHFLKGVRGFSILNFIASTLKQMATEFNIVIILTNLGVIYNENEDEQINTNVQDIKPLMGKYWQHIPNTRIIITRDQDSNKARRLVIQKSDYSATNITGIINISDTGLS